MRWRECATPTPYAPVMYQRGRIRRRSYYRRLVQMLEQYLKVFSLPVTGGPRIDAGPLIGAEDQQLFLGDNFFPWMMVALGAALLVGNFLARVRPPKEANGQLPPLGRTLIMMLVGLMALVWGIATLLSGS